MARAELRHELSLLTSYYQYDEPQIRITAPQIGLDYQIQYKNNDSHFTTRGNARMVYGPANYNGSGNLSFIPNFYGQWEGLAGWQWQAGNIFVTPLIGLGYRTLYYLPSGLSDTGAASYSRVSNYIYLPSKVQLQLTGNNNQIYELTMGFNTLLSGTQKSNLNDTVGYNNITRYDNVTNQQNHGWGAEVSLAYKREKWLIRPYWQYWNIGDSQTKPTIFCTKNASNVTQCETHLLYEPKNTTNEMGVMFGLSF